MTTEEIGKLAISSVLPLLGVIIGGLITFYIQKNSLEKTHAFEREKIRLDNFNKDETEKYIAYNRILLNHGNHKIWIWERHTGGELDYNMYVNYVRPVLFDIFHLLDEEIVKELNIIEDIFERQHYEEEAQEGDRQRLSDSYLKIISEINNKFKEHCNANKK